MYVIRIKNTWAYHAFVTGPEFPAPASAATGSGEDFSKPVARCTIAPSLPIGAVGVSGVKSSADAQIARSGIAAIGASYSL